MAWSCTYFASFSTPWCTLMSLNYRFIGEIPATKPVPHCFPPGPLWNLRRISWRHGCIVSFKAGGVRHHPICHRPGRMLPGPRKPATKLDNLRMLGLQEPLGKAVLQLVASKPLKQSFPTRGLMISQRRSVLSTCFHPITTSIFMCWWHSIPLRPYQGF